jgi:hypothetical protein
MLGKFEGIDIPVDVFINLVMKVVGTSLELGQNNL